MKTLVLTCVLLTLSLQAGAADKGLTEEQMGLSKTPVSVDPDPATFEYRQADPYSGGVLPRAYNGAPPQVPHNLDGLIPITRDSNTCVSCHQQPDQVGKKKVKGQPTAMPASHYTDVKKNALYMGRYNCIQCHTPQANVNNLVGNTFKRK
ncbi:MAG: nitrate reductase cytochrome c-type subunit [Thiobacillus sp.]